jgi:hypothetical protein
MNNVILGLAAVGSAAMITSVAPALAAPISPLVPLTVQPKQEGVIPVHSRSYRHTHCVYRYGERTCWSHGPSVHFQIYPGVRYGYTYKDRYRDDDYKPRRFYDEPRRRSYDEDEEY